MSIDRAHGKINFICDDCGDALETDEKVFLVALEMFKENGWEYTKDEDSSEFVHYCPACSDTLVVD